MNRNEEIAALANEIMIDITDDRLPLHNIMLKAARLSLMLDIPGNVKWFKESAIFYESNRFATEGVAASLDAARDPNVSLSSANPDQHLMHLGNAVERAAIRTSATQMASYFAKLRTETYIFAVGTYTKAAFGNRSESIFEAKRKRAEPTLRAIFPDAPQRLNSIDRALTSENPEDWKNAVVSCRTLISDIADILNPALQPDDKAKTINRLRAFIDAAVRSDTQGKLLKNLADELKKRVELISDSTQGPAHKDRPSLEDAQDTVLYTYLLIADLMELHAMRIMGPLPTEIAEPKAPPIE